jgi:hypothetical protein
MNTTNNYWSLVEVNANDLPDFSMTLFAGHPANTIPYQFYTDSQNRLKSKGNIQTILEMSILMNKSLKILSPNLLFSPDFPDYLLPSDDPKFMEQYPVISATDNNNMPHYRDDLYQRNDVSYKSLSNVPAPHITWGIVRQEPGTVGGEPFRGTQEKKPRHREFNAIFTSDLKKYVGDTTNSNDLVTQYGGLSKYVKVKGQVFDNLVQFNMWARSAWEVEELTEWFKDYMVKYTGMFRESGIVEMWFDRRVRDDTLNQIKNKYHLRSFLYYIRTEKLDISTIEPIKRIEANIHVDSVPQNNSFNIDDYVVDDFHDKLLSKYHTLSKEDFTEATNFDNILEE